MLDASTVFYMDKLVTGPAGVGVVDIRLPIGENIRLLAKALGKPVDEIVVSVLHRPRHERAHRRDPRGRRRHAAHERRRCRRWHQRRPSQRPHRHVRRRRRQPEGIVTACAIKALGGHIQGRLWPRDDDEKRARRRRRAQARRLRLRGATTSCRGNNTIFVATGVTDGAARRRRAPRRRSSTPRASCCAARRARCRRHLVGAPRLEVAVTVSAAHGDWCDGCDCVTALL